MQLSERELEIPSGVGVEDNPIEMVRFWISAGEDHVSLKIGTCVPSENEPEMWGSIIADIAKHAVRGMRQDNPNLCSEDELLARIESGFRERLSQDPDLSGQLKGSIN